MGKQTRESDVEGSATPGEKDKAIYISGEEITTHGKIWGRGGGGVKRVKGGRVTYINYITHYFVVVIRDVVTHNYLIVQFNYLICVIHIFIIVETSPSTMENTDDPISTEAPFPVDGNNNIYDYYNYELSEVQGERKKSFFNKNNDV